MQIGQFISLEPRCWAALLLAEEAAAEKAGNENEMAGKTHWAGKQVLVAAEKTRWEKKKEIELHQKSCKKTVVFFFYVELWIISSVVV